MQNLHTNPLNALGYSSLSQKKGFYFFDVLTSEHTVMFIHVYLMSLLAYLKRSVINLGKYLDDSQGYGHQLSGRATNQ